MKKLTAIFDAVWLPVLLLLATSWLYAPWANHQRIGNLLLISDYEVYGAAWSWFFRLGDIAGAVIMVLVLWRGGVFKRNTILAWGITVIAVLSILDDLFLNSCIKSCGSWDEISHWVHVIETTCNVLAVGFVSFYDGGYHNHRFSRIFLFVEAALGLFALIFTHVNEPALIASQYIYQPLVVIWIAYILRRFAGRPLHRFGSGFRRATALATALLGSFELLQALHLRTYGPLGDALVEHGRSLVSSEHSVLTGLVLLYLARHLSRGERRAALLAVVVLVTAAAKYSLLTPAPLPLLLSSCLLVGFWLGWPAFDRNTTVPAIAGRLKDLAVVAAGFGVAVLALIIIAASAGQFGQVKRDSSALFGFGQHLTGRQKQLERRVHYLSIVSTTLLIGAGTLVLWTIFRPSTREDDTSLDPATVRQLLESYSKSSEDYFKLWPADKRYFTDGNTSGFIAYKRVGGTVFALADPVAAPARRSHLVVSFHAYCRQNGWKICWLLVGESTLHLYKPTNIRTIPIGASAVINVAQFSQDTVRDKWWRWQRNRATKAGFSYDVSLPPHASQLLAEVKTVSDAWLQREGRREQGFALGYFDEQYLQQCVLHLLRDQSGQLLAFANQLPVFNDLKQTTVDLIRFREDAPGAMPMLLSEMIIRFAADETYQTFDLGFVPLAKLDGPLASVARFIGTLRYSAAGLEQFKNKFKPAWQTQYMLYDGDLLDVPAFLASLQRAMAADTEH